MTQPDALKKSEPLTWSTGIGTDVWELIGACIQGDLEEVKRLVAKDPTLARCHYNYRKPLYFAVRENQLAVTEFLLEHDPNPIGLAVNDSPPSLTVADVANFLHVSTATVYRAIQAGDLAAVKLGHRTIRISPDAVTAYIAGRVTGRYPHA